MNVAEVFVGFLAALLVRDLIRYAAGMLDWRWSVNKGGFDTPLRVQIVRAISGQSPKYGR